MTLPSSGPISMDMVATELGISKINLSLTDPRIRDLAGIPSGPISLTALYGKTALAVSLSPTSAAQASNVDNFTFGANTRTIAGAQGGETTQWTAVGAIGGTWDFPGGSTNATATPRVTGVGAGASSNVTIRCTVTRGSNVVHADAPYSYTNTSILP